MQGEAFDIENETLEFAHGKIGIGDYTSSNLTLIFTTPPGSNFYEIKDSCSLVEVGTYQMIPTIIIERNYFEKEITPKKRIYLKNEKNSIDQA
jgi:hypothetical protein